MTQNRVETLALLTRYYEAFAAHDHATMLDCLTDDIEHRINQGPVEHGKEAFAAFMVTMDTAYQETLADMVLFANDEGTRAAAEFRVLGKYLKTAEGYPEAHGQSYDLPAGAFFDIRDGKIARVSVYYNAEDWVAQVS
ncbi:ketosteroid isomerase-related protein [Celeribacter sp. PS-C1]|uniref:ketosteroid isomerase-related protein n=1 Tax=Celeribacter sp. PS-C1 TaxID=2820813 RepID=UPI001CA471A6|nr:ketosteroid isomerase-related protein [Celeribacter sp. PS-C1]MBW6419581.1 nuclear transport factor 2 family protein [Celeribacter sp. PS-C1]